MDIQCILFRKGHNTLHNMVINYFPPYLQGIIYKESDYDKGLEELQMIQSQYDAEGFVLQKNTGFSILTQHNIPDHVFISTENSLKYEIRLGDRQNAGLFPDSYYIRNWLLHNSKNKNILNLFSYTCSNSVAALRGGANLVINVDTNSPVLSIGRNNHRLNQLDTNRVEFHKKDVLKSWPLYKRKGPFDIIICDPPPSQKGGFSSKKDYPKLFRRLREFITPSGIIIFTLNSQLHDKEYLTSQCELNQLVEVENFPLPESYQDSGIIIKSFTLKEVVE